MKNCPDCNRVLEPATLNPKHQWCSVCAMEFDEKGKKCESHLAPPTAMEPAAEPSAELQVTPIPVAPVARSFPVTGKRFRVAIDKLSFETQDNVTLDVGGTKVVITAL